jgi:RHS repeat-associated protein
MKVILLLDNVRYHHTKSVKGLLESLKNISLKYIPPYSSELNSIEHLWKDIRKNVTHNHLFESIAEVIKASGKQIARNLYGINLLMRTVDGESYYYMYNGHADVTALVNAATGEVAATYYYDAFGNILESTGDVNNNITYAGYQYDEETGLYYLNARMYDPKIARFLQEDTYRGDPMDPLSLNLYAYCAYNPIMYYDPTGHFSIFSGDDWRKLARNIKEVTIGITDGTMRFISGNAYQSVGSFVGDVRWAFNNREYLTDGTITYFSETASNIKQGIVGFVSDVKWAYKNRDIVAETINESIQQYKADVKWAIDNRDIVAETTKDMAKQAVHYFNNKSMREKIAIITDVTLNIASFIGVPEAAAAKLTQLKKVDKLVDTVNLVDKLYDAGAGMRRLDNVLDATNMIDDLYNAGRGMKQLDRVADTVTALRKSDRLVEASTGIRFMDNIDDFGRVGIPELPKNAIQKNYLEVTRAVNNVGSGVGGNKNLVNKAWKKKIVMPNAPHTNGTPGHWFAIKRKAVELAKMDDVEKVFINKGLSNVVPGAKPNRRPDIVVKRINGLIDQFEVPSKTDRINDLLIRMRQNQSILGDKAGSIDIVYIKR